MCPNFPDHRSENQHLLKILSDYVIQHSKAGVRQIFLSITFKGNEPRLHVPTEIGTVLTKVK